MSRVITVANSQNFLKCSKANLDLSLLSSEHPSSSSENLPSQFQFATLRVLSSCVNGWDNLIHEKDDCSSLSGSSIQFSTRAILSHFHMKTLTGGMTNKVFYCEKLGVNGSERVLLRCFGVNTNSFIDRENEIKIFEYLSETGLGPKLLGKFSNGRVEEYLNAYTLTPDDMRCTTMIEMIARKLSFMHKLQPSFLDKSPQLFNTMNRWYSLACQKPVLDDVYMALLEKCVGEVRVRLEYAQSPSVFCHNDLQYGNMMFKSGSNFVIDDVNLGIDNSQLTSTNFKLGIVNSTLGTDGNKLLISRPSNGKIGMNDSNIGTLYLIDYEYSCYNFRGFDIGNYFCEYCADYTTPTPHVFDIQKYPSPKMQYEFCKAYLGNCATSTEIENLMLESREFSLASHVLWACWGLFQAHMSEIDFDYVEYTRERIRAYLYFSNLWADGKLL